MYFIYKIDKRGKRASQQHLSCINTKTSYSLTLNINKRCANEYRRRSYETSLREVKDLFNKLGPYLNRSFIGVEYNKSEQIHYHTYFSLKDGITDSQLVDLIKYHLTDSKTLWRDHGYGWKLKYIDALTDDLKDYVWKDTSRTLQLSLSGAATFIPSFYGREYESNIFTVEKQEPRIIRKKKTLVV